jgi:O-antigen/teichoic acid export membrane protein
MSFLITVQAVLIAVGMVGLAWLGGKTVEFMQWQAIIGIAMLIAHLFIVMPLLRPLKLRPSWSVSKSRSIGRYSLLTWISSIGGALFSQGDRIIVGSLLGTNVLGIYAAITNITIQINTLSALPVQPILPLLTALVAKDAIDRSQLYRNLKLAFGVNSIVALGIGAALFASAPFVMNILVSQTPNDETVLAFRIAVIIYALYSLNAVGYYMLFALDAVHISLIINLVSSILSLILIAIMSVRVGLLGSVAGNIGYLLSLLFVPIGLRQISALLAQRKAMVDVVA